MRRLGRTAFILSIWFCATTLCGQVELTANTLKPDEASAGVSVPLEMFDFLAGSWRGEGMGSQVEEIWTRGAGGSLMGAFRLYDDDGVSFYELMHIRDTDEGIVLQLKHFNADLTGWEEKADMVTFPLVKAEENAAYFRGLTYRRRGENGLDVYLALTEGGKTREVPFHFERVTD